MNENISPSWSFNLDQVEEWAYCDNVFTQEECEKIVEEGKKRNLKSATLLSKENNSFSDESTRKSNVSWIVPSIEVAWIYQKVSGVVMNLNDRYFGFDLFGINEAFQFTEYTSDNGHYSKHVDRKYGYLVRKLSVSVQLTDPLTYSGGELLLYFDKNPTRTKIEQGSLIIFPSYTMHEVTPVTKGTRYSLVAWVTGKKFI